MKTNGVVVLMMIMLGFVQIIEIGALSCEDKCAIECIPSLEAYPLCYISCVVLCETATTCARSCGKKKSITVNIDAAGKVANVVDSCLHGCRKSQ
ncbi:hypothetical protein DEO72_LG3g2692 [Vigna unguiculata]|uniref:Uncharacterized protein n=1 Tax=Vigna unguiculata TaxID=3917 RepID=A0A4D6LHY8_VIGUN|nr:hypothetical protein DEO72_LG3g2692 [Vigna unguiculata]